MTKGRAEIFGSELVLKKTYTFTDRNIAIFTWHGCTLELSGTGIVMPYVSDTSPMRTYLDVHASLEEKRRQAKLSGHAGPVVMIVGPVDAGKSTLCHILLNYAVRRGHVPIFADLDVGQTSVSVPGSISAAPLTECIDPVSGIPWSLPLSYFYGSVTPSDQPDWYKECARMLFSTIKQRLSMQADTRASGVIINTCGWIDGLGFKLLTATMLTVEPDVVLVLGEERLHVELEGFLRTSSASSLKKKPELVKIPKSGGAMSRTAAVRRELRMDRYRQYFYGTAGDLQPINLDLHFNDLKIYRAEEIPPAPASALPVGMEATQQEALKVVPIKPSAALEDCIVAVLYATSEADILTANVAGFLRVVDVSLPKERITFLAPTPGPLPSMYLLLGDSKMKWQDN